MPEDKNDKKPVILSLKQRKEILHIIATRGNTQDKIAEIYGCSLKTIQRVPYNALKWSPEEKALRPQEDQDYLKHLESMRLTLSEGAHSRQRSEPYSDDLDKHYDELIVCAKELVELLPTCIIDWDESEGYTLDTVLIESRDFEMLEFINRPISGCLLYHLAQSELLSELKDLPTWGYLKVKNINESLLECISFSVALRDFNGTCKKCPPKTSPNSPRL